MIVLASSQRVWQKSAIQALHSAPQQDHKILLNPPSDHGTDLSMLPEVIRYRERRPGPELAIENAVEASLNRLLPENPILASVWMAGSLPLGAGLPDLAIATFKPLLVEAPALQSTDALVLAYLRSVWRATADTVAKRLRLAVRTTSEVLARLMTCKAIVLIGNAYTLARSWRDILTDVTTVESKVADWKGAVQQASRNMLFSHRSYIAMPAAVAERVISEDIIAQKGVGVLSVHGDTIDILKEARRTTPRIWAYYYKIAYEIAATRREGGD